MKRKRHVIMLTWLLLCATMACNQLVPSSSTTAPQATAAPQATEPPEPTAAPRPTATPKPTEMPQQAATPIPGWERFEGGGAELWLPQSFEGGDISQDVGLIAENLRRLGPDFEQIAQMIELNPSLYAIWAFDSDIGDSGFLTNVNVIADQVLSAFTLEMYIDMSLSQFPSQFQVVEQDIVSVGDYQAGRLVVEFAIAGATGKELLYVIKDGSTMWVITFATAMEEYDQRLPVFEQSVLTFAVQD